MKKVICISGKARSGKDTVAQMIKAELELKEQRVLVTHYADLLKYICKTFLDWDGEKDQAGRTLLQYVGTEVIRKQDPDYWVNFIIQILKFFNEEWDYVIISDARFPNELDRLKEESFNTLHIHVEGHEVTELTSQQKNHSSETALDNVEPDIVLYNTSTLDVIEHQVIFCVHTNILI